MTEATPTVPPRPVAPPVPVPVPVPIPVPAIVIHKVADEEPEAIAPEKPIKKEQYVNLAPVAPAMPSILTMYEKEAAKEEALAIDAAVLGYGEQEPSVLEAPLDREPVWVRVLDRIVVAFYFVANAATSVGHWIASIPGRIGRAVAKAGKSVASFSSQMVDYHAQINDHGDANYNPRVQKSLGRAGFNKNPEPPVGASGTSAGSPARKELHPAIKRENLVISGFKVASIKVSIDPYTKRHHVVIVADAIEKSIVHISDPDMENMIVDLYQEG